MSSYSVRVMQPAYLKHKRKFQMSPRGRYMEQKSKAWGRRIPWRFTFETWWALWEKSGKWKQRGNSKGKYCMCRYEDKGPYSPENCFIGPYLKNFLWGNTHPEVRARHAKSYDQYAFK